MKIALVIDDNLHRPGGVQEYVRGLYSYLASVGHQVKIITGGEQHENHFKEDVIQIGKSIELKGNDTSLTFPIMVSDEEIVNTLMKEKFDIIHIQAPFSPTLSGKIIEHSDSTNIITFLVYHDSKMGKFLINVFSTFLLKFGQKIHGKITISPVALESAIDTFKDSIEEYEMIPLGIDIDRFNTSVKKIERFDDEKVNILFVNRLDKRKGAIYLVKAFEKLKKRVPDVRLIMVGDGPEKKKVERYIKRKKIKDVYLEGYVDRNIIPKYFSTADIFCSPATGGESFGLVLLEAMASGKPIVTFDIPGYRSVIPKHQKHFLVPNKDVEALEVALFKLVQDENLREKIGKLSRKESLKYSWENIGSQIVRFYQKTMKKRQNKSFYN